MESIGWLIALCLSVVHTIGLLSALHAVLNAPSSSGAIAWSISLVTFPYLTLPLYWVLSRRRFYGYVKLLRDHSLIHNRYREVEELTDSLQSYRAYHAYDTPDPAAGVLERLSDLPFTNRNKVKILVDGAETFKVMFDEIDRAQDYVLVLFYIIGDDDIGNEFKEHLLAKVDEGVRVYVLYDELGCMTFLSQNYIDEMKDRGVEMHPFYTTRGSFNKLQYNFRNHRKIVVVDGKVALSGGINVHDDSWGKSKHYGNWRDTHTIAWGPIVQNIQFIWAEDYYWATASLPQLNWEPIPAPEGDSQKALYVATGPASNLPSGVLFFVHCIQQAKKRLWVASPYFIPDPSVIEALILASLRGVDVRIILPERYDMLIMYLAAFSSILEIEHSGIRVFRYRTGYPHQKCMLIDDEMGWIGTSNLDNRSMRLNFEGNLVVQDPRFCREMEEMLQKDLERSVEVGPEDYYSRGLLFKLGVKLARLFAPVL